MTESGITVDEKELLKHALHQIAVRQLYLQLGITAKTLQEELHVPASLFGTYFKEQTGHSFSEHINKLRMDYAAKLLTEYPQYTIDAIAKMCGIDSRQHFQNSDKVRGSTTFFPNISVSRLPLSGKTIYHLIIRILNNDLKPM